MKNFRKWETYMLTTYNCLTLLRSLTPMHFSHPQFWFLEMHLNSYDFYKIPEIPSRFKTCLYLLLAIILHEVCSAGSCTDIFAWAPRAEPFILSKTEIGL